MRLLIWLISVAIATTMLAEPKFTQYPKRFGPFFDIAVPPNYPEIAIAWHKHGEGWFELTINPDTGAVREVKVLKSTGAKILDDAAAAAFLQWKAKPHMLTHATVPTQFRMRPPIGSHLAP